MSPNPDLTALQAQLVASKSDLDALRLQLGADGVRSESFETRTGTVERLRPKTFSGAPLMIKRSPQWEADHARGMWITLALLRSYSDRTGLAPFAAAPRHWGPNPAYVCADWIEGRSMTAWFSATFTSNESKEAFHRAQEASRRHASLLAHYHRAMIDAETLGDLIPKKSKTVEQTGPGVRMIATLRGADGVERSERVRSIDDPGPHNAVEGPDGALWLIDLPAHLKSVMVERDVARLASRLVGAVRNSVGAFWIPRLGHYRRIVDAVVEGYEAVGSPEGRPLDRSLIYACLAADAALKVAFTRRRLAPGVRFEAFIREFMASALLSAGALWLRFRQPTPQR